MISYEVASKEPVEIGAERESRNQYRRSLARAHLAIMQGTDARGLARAHLAIMQGMDARGLARAHLAIMQGTDARGLP